ncbi:MAG: YbaB/EbfC family nucleoid-associated protein [Phycisphaerales bacterium JB061]
MFGLKNMGAIASLMGRKDELKAAAEELGLKIADLRIEGQAGGGACRVVVSGKQRVERIDLDPAVCAGLGASEDSRVQAQRLITEATNDALENCQNRIKEMVEAEVRRLGLEDLIPAGGGGGLGPIGKLLG